MWIGWFSAGTAGLLSSVNWNFDSPCCDGQKRTQWIVWDIPMAKVLLHPKMATMKKVKTPPENLQRDVWIYDSIDSELMTESFCESVKRFAE